MNSVFLDTNIFLEIFLNRAGKDECLALLAYCEAEGIEKSSSSKSVLDIHFFLKKSSIAPVLRKNLLNDLLNAVQIAGASKPQLQQAINATGWNDFEDAVQYFTALSVPDIDAIITYNTRDFRHSSLPVFNP